MCSHLGETDDSTSTRGVVFNLTCVKMTYQCQKSGSGQGAMHVEG